MAITRHIHVIDSYYYNNQQHCDKKLIKDIFSLFTDLFGEITGTIRRIQNLVVKYREIESKSQSYWMCRSKLGICNILKARDQNDNLTNSFLQNLNDFFINKQK